MDAKKCDRCGKFYSTPSLFRMYSINLTGGYTLYRCGNRIDLCSACHDKLIAFMEFENLTKEEKGAKNNEP